MLTIFEQVVSTWHVGLLSHASYSHWQVICVLLCYMQVGSDTLHIIMYVCLQIQMQIQESTPSPECYTMQCTLPCELTRPFPSLVEPACYSKFIIHVETQVQYESQCWLTTLAIWCYINACWYLYLAPWNLQVLHYTLTILMIMQRQVVMNTPLISVQNIVVNHLNLPDRVVNTVAWHR